METTGFALYTTDQKWIARHDGHPGENGRVVVQVPAGEVERITLGGRPALRHRFTDVPADGGTGSYVCIAAWAEAPEVTARRPEALNGRALFLAMAREEGMLR